MTSLMPCLRTARRTTDVSSPPHMPRSPSTKCNGDEQNNLLNSMDLSASSCVSIPDLSEAIGTDMHCDSIRLVMAASDISSVTNSVGFLSSRQARTAMLTPKAVLPCDG